MATAHLMTGRYIPHFGLNTLIFILSFGEIFSYFATSCKWNCPTFQIGKKSRLFKRFFQYSVICHSSKYIGLALTDFNKHGYFIGIACGYNWAKFKKNSPKEMRENSLSFAFCPHVDVIKIEKHLCFLLSMHRLLELSSYACMQENFKWVLGTCRLLGW